MIGDEQRARIRRLFYAEHWKVGTIAAELGVHHDTVRRALEVERFRSGGSRVVGLCPRPVQALRQRECSSEHPRLRATRLFEMIKERGYTGSEVIVRRYVRTVRPLPREAFFRLETMPGEQGQVDWASFGKIHIGSAQRALSCFVMVLSLSRAVFARFVLDQTMESFLRVPRRGASTLSAACRAPCSTTT